MTATEKTAMGEKRRVKSKGKTARSTKHGLRPHELRQQHESINTAAGQTAQPTDRKEPKP
jgi:hypothetical protein